jgi:hypothetical protein
MFREFVDFFAFLGSTMGWESRRGHVFGSHGVGV